MRDINWTLRWDGSEIKLAFHSEQDAIECAKMFLADTAAYSDKRQVLLGSLRGPGGREIAIWVAVEVVEPECPSGNHRWESHSDLVGGTEAHPGLWTHQDGFIKEECCMACGCRKVVDTYAKTTTFAPGYYREALKRRGAR